MSAGFVNSNSEIGHKSVSMTPRLVAQVHRNVYAITRDAMREVHLGGRLDTGLVAWSERTQRAALELITRWVATGSFLTGTIPVAAVSRSEDGRACGSPTPGATTRHGAGRLRFGDA